MMSGIWHSMRTPSSSFLLITLWKLIAKRVRILNFEILLVGGILTGEDAIGCAVEKEFGLGKGMGSESEESEKKLECASEE